jgi:tRNA threonylcarbamoyladenosine biosynthesis protein TsaE
MARERTLHSASAAATEALGAALGELLAPGTLLLLDGELGAGKTCLVRGLARGLGVRERISSPTYALMQSYAARHGPFHHLDAWMEGRERSLLAEGGAELLCAPAISAIEWAARVEDQLPPERLRIAIEELDMQSRRLHLEVEGEGALAARLEQALDRLPAIPGIRDSSA